MYYNYLFTGSPRCGSGFVVRLFRNCGINLGHEVMKPEGIVSWLCANRHLKTGFEWGYKMYENREDKFDKMIHYVRNPKDAIPSLYMENKI